MKPILGLISYQDGAAKGSISCFFSFFNDCRVLLVIVNEVQIQGKEEEIEGEKVGDFSDSIFHITGF